MNWTKERIKNEIIKMDRLTGLNGANLAILWDCSEKVLGSFKHNEYGEPISFTFSRLFFDHPDFSYEEALDTIAHEYAHYMDVAIYGIHNGSAHGKSWKKCCHIVGARPYASCCLSLDFKVVIEQRIKETQEKYLSQEKEWESLVKQSFPFGSQVVHPLFGTGIIQAIDLGGIKNTRLTISFCCFEKAKKFNAQWILEHCE